jgi:hypothetical protein
MMDDLLHMEKNFHKAQVGEFTLPYSYLDYHFTERLREDRFINNREFIKILNLMPDNNARNLKVEADIYRLVEN